MILKKNAIYGVLLSGLLYLTLSTTGYAADAAPQNQTQNQTQTQTKNSKKGNVGDLFFALSRTSWKAIEQSDNWAEQATHMTTLPFYLVTDFVMLATVSTVSISAPFLAATQQRAAAWNNPRSMIAKATEPQGSR